MPLNWTILSIGSSAPTPRPFTADNRGPPRRRGAIRSSSSGSNRFAAARIKCQNNLKQLGLALHAYHDAHQKFPQAYNEFWNFCEPADAPADPDFRPRKSWASLILPHIEQQNIAAEDGPSAQQRDVTVFLCPADPRRGAPSDGGHYKYLGARFGLTSYLAVEGSGYDRGPSDTNLNLEFGGPRDGILYRSSDTRLTDVTDGTSNTALLGANLLYEQLCVMPGVQYRT